MVAGRCGVVTPAIILIKHLIRSNLREEVYLAHGSDAKVHHGGADIGGWSHCLRRREAERDKCRSQLASSFCSYSVFCSPWEDMGHSLWVFFTLTPLWKHHKVTPRALNLMSVADLS